MTVKRPYLADRVEQMHIGTTDLVAELGSLAKLLPPDSAGAYALKQAAGLFRDAARQLRWARLAASKAA